MLTSGETIGIPIDILIAGDIFTHPSFFTVEDAVRNLYGEVDWGLCQNTAVSNKG